MNRGAPPGGLPYGRVLVTGGAGFIGSHLVDRLLAAGVEVAVLDNFDPFYDPVAKWRNIAPHRANPAFHLVQGDIRDEAAVREALRALRPQAVVHLAARAGVRPSAADPVLYTDVNVRGTAILLHACRRYGVERFIFGSSSSVYGGNTKVPFAEDDPVLQPASPYGATKVAGEALGASFSRCYGLPVVALRFFTVYGPRQRPDLAIHKFARRLLAGEPLPVYGNGESERDYTYIDDIVDGILRALAYDGFPDPSLPYRVFNLGSDCPVRLADLIARLARLLGRPARVESHPPHPGDMERTWADLTRSRRELGYNPRVPLEEGLERFVAWLRRGEWGA